MFALETVLKNTFFSTLVDDALCRVARIFSSMDYTIFFCYSFWLQKHIHFIPTCFLVVNITSTVE